MQGCHKIGHRNKQCCGSESGGPGSGVFLTAGSGIRIRDPGWGENGPGSETRDEQAGSYFREKYLNSLMRIRILEGNSDPGSGRETFGSGTRNKHPGFATLEIREDFKVSFSSLLLTTLFLDKPHWFVLSIEEILRKNYS
jgi:hypothetical protein